MTVEEFLQFAEPLPEPTLLMSGDGRILSGNTATEERLGIGLATLLGQRLADVVSDPPDEVTHYLRTCSRNRKMVLGSLTLVRSDGSTIDCRTEGAVLRPKRESTDALLLIRLIPKGSSVGQFVALNQRIEEQGRELLRRKQTEEALHRQKELLRVTLASIGDAMITTDLDGRITYLNPVAEKLTGWTDQEARGNSLESVFTIINEHTRQPVNNPATKALREGTIVGLANHTILIAKDGTERPVDDSAAPIRDEHGHVAGVVLVFRDVSERKQAEESLRATEKQFHTLADSIPQLAWMTKADGHIDWYNKRWYEYTGTTLQDMEGWQWQSVHDPAELPRVLDNWRHALTIGEPWEDIFPLRRHDGAMRWHLSRAVPLKDEEGRVVRWFGTNTDITEQRLMAEELRKLASHLSEADRRKNEFLAMLAHELRNPLAPIRNSLQLLRLTSSSDETTAMALEMMDRQVGHMVRLIDDLLDVSRISRGKIELRKEAVELLGIVKLAVEAARPLAESMGHELTIEFPSQPIFVEGDATRLSQVVGNVLNNACKYTENNGRIWVIVEADGEDAVIRIKDTGVGIAVDQIPFLFEMFSQINTSLERSQSGLGIGLALVKQLVEMHGGTVEAHSLGLKQGSEFVVRLPAVIEQADGPPAPGESNYSAVPTAKRRVLVVDDNKDSARSLEMLLKVAGNDTYTAHDGDEAVKVAGAMRPEVILLDLGLPKLNGFEACRKIREQSWAKNAIIVALTGWGQEEDRRKSSEAGFDGHLVKPVQFAELNKLLAELSIGSA